MELAVLFCFLLGIAFSASVQFQIKNACGGPVWIGIQGGANRHPHLQGGGFVLERGRQRTINSPDRWEGRFWARTWCDPRTRFCQTGDCGPKIQCNGAGGRPPVTLVEIKLKGDKGLDYYDISLVDGFNTMAVIAPIGGRGDCPRLGCRKDLNVNCPRDLRIIHNRQTIACNSACNKEPTNPKYCCTGEYNNPHKCKANDWPANLDSARYFKKNCPDAYSYAYDDQTSLKTCKANKYYIQFC